MKILIVGGGITGTVLALRLLEKNVDVTLVDNRKNECSTVAGGILNPLVFRRMHLSWRVEEFFPEAKEFYLKYAPDSWNNLVIRRLFPSEQEKNFWLEKQHLPVFSDYMQPMSAEDEHFDWETNTFGTGKVKTAGWINAEVWFKEIFQLLEEKATVIESEFDYDLLDPAHGTYQGVSYDSILFAEGKGIQQNPWFNYLPLIPTKGELLTITSDFLPEDEEMNRKCFVIPLGDKTFKVGSTYDFNTSDTIVTEKNAAKIKENLRSITTKAYSVIGQTAGIRPTVPDRRPLLGRHADFPKLAIANGMGTKGFLIAPKLMSEFADYIVDGIALPEEVDIRRFEDKRQMPV